MRETENELESKSERDRREEKVELRRLRVPCVMLRSVSFCWFFFSFCSLLLHLLALLAFQAVSACSMV